MNAKILKGAILESTLLNIINETSDSGLYGYAILKAIQKKFHVHLGCSSIYPELRRLERRGLIASRWDLTFERARRQYRITQKGRSLLKEYFLDFRAIIPDLVTSRA